MGPKWIPTGPAPEVAADGTTVSGLVKVIAVSENYDGLGHRAMFLGAKGGGIWRSVNVDAPKPTWMPLTDSLDIPFGQKRGILNVTALRVSPLDPRVVFASAGFSYGVLRSQDGGNHWAMLGHDTFKGGWEISGIVVDPTDTSGNTIYVAGGGVASCYKSVDGGVNWTAINKGLPPGATISALDYRIAPLVAPPPNYFPYIIILIAGVTYADDPTKKGIWSSIDGQGWDPMPVTLLDLASGQVLDRSAIGEISFAFDHTFPAPNARAYGYAAISHKTTGNLLTVVAYNGGVWTPINTNLPKTVVTQSGANLTLGLSPYGTIYLGTQARSDEKGLFRSTDLGANWVDIGLGTDGVRPHVDAHAWGFAGGAVYAGNDGGIWRFIPPLQASKEVAGPGTWESLNGPGLQTHRLNGVSMHPTNINSMLVGSWDNATSLRTQNGWKEVGGGDTGGTRFDPDPTQQGTTAYFVGAPEPDGAGDRQYFYRSNDGGNTWHDISPKGNAHIPDFSDQFTAFAIYPHDTSRLIVGLNQVYETRDRGNNWKAISPPLDGDNTISALTYATDPKVIYAAFSTSGGLWRTVNGGGDTGAENWDQINGGTKWQGKISSIVVAPGDSDTVYVATLGGEVWRTGNGGAKWEEITGSLPSLRLNVLALYPGLGTPGPWLFTGTDVGVFASTSQGASTNWTQYGDALPDAVVKDLEVNLGLNLLVAATDGRGSFIVPIEEPVLPQVHIKERRDDCNIPAAEGGVATFTAEVTGYANPAALEYKWSVQGANVLSAANAEYSVQLNSPSGAVTVSVEITLPGAVINASTGEFQPLTVDQATRMEHICRLIHMAHINFLPDPLLDPTRDFIARPILEREVRHLQGTIEQMARFANAIANLRR